jgi:heme/copper-type cytochrome/quinol oxidase subunit 3
MVLALAAIQENNKPKFNKFLGLVILGGLMFLGCQAYEWTHLLTHRLPEAGISFSNNLFATTFFILTGFHGMHVTGGVIYNSCVLAAVNRGRYEAKHVEIAGLYWHFVDLVWILIFTFVYLI